MVSTTAEQATYYSADVERRSRNIFILAMLAPAIALLVGFTIIPFLVSVWLSLTDYMLSNPPARFIGLQNYIELLQSGEFWDAFGISATFTVAAVCLELVIGLVIAVLLAATASRAAFLLRTIYILPLAITPIAIMFTFRMILNPSLGVANYFVRLVGLAPQDWLGSTSLTLTTLVVIDAWQWVPFIMIILVGGLASLPHDPFEAAQLDGANSWQMFCYITLPMLLPFIIIASLFRTIDAFKTFDLVYILTSGGPGTTTTTLNLFAFKQAIEYTALGRGSAIAIIIMIIITIASQILLRRTRLLEVSEDSR